MSIILSGVIEIVAKSLRYLARTLMEKAIEDEHLYMVEENLYQLPDVLSECITKASSGFHGSEAHERRC